MTPGSRASMYVHAVGQLLTINVRGLSDALMAFVSSIPPIYQRQHEQETTPQLEMGTCSRPSAFLMRKSICSRPSLYSRPGHARAREGKTIVLPPNDAKYLMDRAINHGRLKKLSPREQPNWDRLLSF